MKRIFTSIILLSACIIALSSAVLTDNGKAGYNGAPGEVTCNTTNCHNSFALNSGGGSVVATCNMVNWKYDPMTTYTISIKVARTGNHLFGVGAEILNNVNDNAGMLTITDAVHTQIKTRTVSGISRRNVVHTLNGGNFQDSAVFTFNWTSPDTTAGPLTMYFSGNAANGTGSPAGDYIYTATQQIFPSTGNSINQIKTSDDVRIYPNPANEKFYVHYNTPKNESFKVFLYDLKGAKQIELLSKISDTGENNDVIPLPDNLPAGVYFIRLESPSMNKIQKLIVQ